MKSFFVFFILGAVQVAATEATGFLIYKNDQWTLKLESFNQSPKKGNLEVRGKLPFDASSFPSDGLYVLIKGQHEECGKKNLCIIAESVQPQIYDPLVLKKRQ